MEERVQTYINGQTPIMAEALNAIQDAIIANSKLIGTQATQISSETSAREAADTALGNEVDDLNNALFAENAVVSADLTSLSRSINVSSKWAALSGAAAGYIAIPGNAEKIVITPKSGVTNVWAFLNSIGTPATGETPDFSATYPARITANTSTPQPYAVEPDMHFIYFLQTNTNSVDVFPASVSIYTNQLTGEIAAEATARAAADTALGDDISDLKSALNTLFRAEQFNFSTVTPQMWTITSGNSWGHVTTGSGRSYVLDVNEIGNPLTIRVTAKDTENAIIAFLSEFEPVHGSEPVWADGYNGRIEISPGETDEFILSYNTNFIYMLYLDSTSVDHTPNVEMYYEKTDTSLTKTNISADAGAVGVAITNLTNKVDGKYGFVGSLTSESNIDNIANGVYRFTSADCPQGLPKQSAGSLFQYGTFGAGHGIVQIVVYGTGVEQYFRYKTTTTWTNFAKVITDRNVEKYLEEYLGDSVAINTSNADALSKSNGQIYEIPIICYIDGPRYIVQDGNIVESEEGDLWTDYIECPKYLLVDMEDNTVRLMIYFYDKVGDNYIPRWDLLDTTASSGAKNYLNLNICRNRAIAIPDGVYMRVSKAVEGDAKLYGWSGAHVGCELAGQSLSYDSESNTWKPYGTKDGITFMVIPGNAELWFSKNAALVELFGYKDGNRTTIVDSTWNKAFTQCLRLPKGYDYFYASVVLDYYISATQTGKGSLVHSQKLIDLNDYVSLLMHYDECAIPVGRGRTVIDWAKYIAEIEWTSKRNKSTVHVGTVYGTFKKDYKYTGIPYTSAWDRPSFFGWHISRHTFMNAANDSRSEFYEKSDRRGGSMGYGLVCSSYASLASGWEYPQTCAGFSMDPNVVMGYDYQPSPGNIYAVSSHSLIPETNGKGTGFESYTLYEQSGPATKRTVNFSFRDGGDNARSYSYINHYFKKFTNIKSHDNPTAYDIENYQITNGSARPFRGDRCVFTSAESDGVRINIRVDNATTLYYQECTYDPSTDVFTPVGAIMQKAIDAYVSEPTSVNIDESTLGDGKFYCVYTDVDSTKEHFEYHVVNTETWGKTDNNINFSRNDFWYAMWWQTSETETEDENVATVCLPANADGDYTEFRKLCNPSAAASCKMFFKGVLGAYCTTVEYVG